MKNYKIVVAYDGTDFYGWQRQKHESKTIVGVLESTFESVFGKTIALSGASRTDAGVHAAGQMASFMSDLAIEPEQMRHAWQNILPDSILIRSIAEVGLEWRPRGHVLQKVYYYHFFQERVLPFYARYGWYYHRPVDLQKLQEALNVFIGTHDFRSFCTGQEYQSTITRIDSINIEYLSRFKAYRIIVKGPAFFRYMIRRIVGACLMVSASKTLPISHLESVLKEKNPEQMLYTAPAQGLLLYKIIYQERP